MQKQVLTVSQINHILARHIEQNSDLRNVSIKGEIGNFSQSKAGHIYFNLKDENAIISVNVWKNLALSLPRDIASWLKEGAEIIVSGNIQLYEKGGTINLIATNIELSGEGDLFKRFQQLKNKLESLGFFDPSHKKPIMRFNQNVGVITALTGAVIQDIQSTIKRRFPNINLYLYNVSVQGINAEKEIIHALKTADKNNHDVILLARGGGSLEDLWTFNSEMIAIEIYNLNTPIISAIGHETDFTIADFVADLRAATPTAGAELLNPHYQDIKGEVKTLLKNLVNQIDARLMKLKLEVNEFDKKLSQIPKQVNQLRNSFTTIENKFVQLTHQFVSTNKQSLNRIQSRLNNTINQSLNIERRKINSLDQNLNNVYKTQINTFKIELDNLSKKISFSIRNKLKNLQHQLKLSEQALINNNPDFLSKKGYIYMTKNKQLIRDAKQLKPQDEVVINFSKQEVYATIDNIKLKGDKNG